MKTNQSISKNVAKTFLVILFSIAVIISLSCLTLHLNPLQLEGEIFEFAEHHYFLFGFISFLIGMIAVRAYMMIYIEVSSQENNVSKALNNVFGKQYKYTDNTENDSDYQFIEKNKIENLNFPKEDVLNSPEEIKLREHTLIKSMSLGNRYKHKVKIFFKDINNKRYTETTIWYADTKYITIKGGIALPVRSIYKIEI
jgi:hypothetical protein